MTDHMELIERANEAINEVFSDTSIPQQDTLYSLKGLRDEINTMIDAVEHDLRSLVPREDVPF